MAVTKAKRHTHKYHRVDLSFGRVWACALPDCNHHMPEHYSSLVPGKASICWSCGEKFVLNPENMKSDRPVCESCETGLRTEDIDIVAPDSPLNRFLNNR